MIWINNNNIIKLSRNFVKYHKSFDLSKFLKSVTINSSASHHPRRSKRSFPSANRERQFCMKDSSQSLSTLHKGLISFCSLSLASRLLSTHLSAWLPSRILLSRYLTWHSSDSVRRLWFLSFINPRSLRYVLTDSNE